MTQHEILTVFADAFVQKHLRARFLHESERKPMRLAARLSHGLPGLLLPQYRGGKVSFKPGDECLCFTRSDFQLTTWGDAMRKIEYNGGGGNLVIDVTGCKFFADSEGFPPPDIYAGAA